MDVTVSHGCSGSVGKALTLDVDMLASRSVVSASMEDMLNPDPQDILVARMNRHQTIRVSE